MVQKEFITSWSKAFLLTRSSGCIWLGWTGAKCQGGRGLSLSSGPDGVSHPMLDPDPGARACRPDGCCGGKSGGDLGCTCAFSARAMPGKEGGNVSLFYGLRFMRLHSPGQGEGTEEHHVHLADSSRVLS